MTPDQARRLLMQWILIISLALIAVLLVRQLGGWGSHGFALPLLAIVALVSGFFVWRDWSLERDLTAAAQAISGDGEVTVNCQGFLREFRLDNNLGEVAFDGKGGLEKAAQLRSSVCSQLRGWLGSDKSEPSRDDVIAVHVLSHEVIHASGIASEGETECLAMQHDELLAIELGATPAQARALADRYWREVFPRMPNRYRAIECRPDGALDVSPGDGLWPGREQLPAGL